jgi:nifR3 family TIM-barrel protein
VSNFWKKLKKPITALAPMDDVTDFVFREIISNIAKPDVLFTEFTSSDALFSKGHERVEKKLIFSEIQRPIVAQLWGSTPENFKKAANLIQDLGFDGIDINMGCPDRAIMSRNSGAALINNKELVEEIISEIRKGSKLPLSIKTRLDKTEELTKEWISFLLSKDIDTLIIHGRNAKALYKGEADWEEIGKAVELKNKINPDIILIGNGDVKSYKEVEAKYKIYGVDGVMIGRGVFHNPWVFEKNEELIPHSKGEYIDLLLTHSKLFHEKWGETKNFETMKKFFKIYVNGFKGANLLRQKLMETRSYEEVSEVIGNFKK